MASTETAALAPRKRKQYSSPAMSERRQRIVACAHEMLGEGGTQHLTIDRLSRAAGVAPRTIYRLFGDKESVILATVTDRLREVRAHLAAKCRVYDLATVLDELDWMVSEMRRDFHYGRMVIGFFFARPPRDPAVRELTSVAHHRFGSWLDREVLAGHVDTRLDLDRLTQEHVADEFGVYNRWVVDPNDERCRLELRCCFLKSALVLLVEPERSRYFDLLVQHQRELAASLADMR